MKSREVNNKTYSPYQFASSFLVIAQNPTLKAAEEAVQIEVPFQTFQIQQIDGPNGELENIQYDSFTPYKFLGGDQLTPRYMAQFKVKFAENERQKVFLVSKDKFKQSFAQAGAFEPATNGKQLKYGNKKLTYLGTSQEKDGKLACMFQFEDATAQLTQKFKFSPRVYLANETEGNGEGLYEFRPMERYSKIYSQIQAVQMKEGKSSGQFLITYEDGANATKQTKARLTAILEISADSEFIT